MSGKQKKLTGYPSVDKPWLKYYSEEVVNARVPDCTIYEFMRRNNADFSQDICIEYAGRKITYQELFQNIESTYTAFRAVGIKEGDVVAVIAVSVPEIIYSFYAVNRIGAVSDYFDPGSEVDMVRKELIETDAKAILIFEDYMERFADMVSGFDISKIMVSAKDSLPNILKTIKGLMPHKKYWEFDSYEEFIRKHGSEKVNGKALEGKAADLPAIMEHTDGTTGMPKTVVLSNQNVNSVVFDYQICGLPMARKERWLAQRNPFTAYSLVCTQHLPISLGMECVLNFSLDAKKIEKMLIKGRINHAAHTPVIWEKILCNKRAVPADLSLLVTPIVCADTLNIVKENQINAFLRKHTCCRAIAKSYGMTEVSSASTLCCTNEVKKITSVGIPFPHMTVAIFDPITEQEVPYGMQGEICITGPSVMLGYFKQPKETSAILRRHTDGQKWIHSGDLGYMDEDGFLYVEGRLKRMLINYLGFKIFPPDIEKVLMQHGAVEKCCVVGADDKEHGRGQNTVAFIVPKHRKNIDKKELADYCAQRMVTYKVPVDYVIVKELPYTAAAKVDYRTLEEKYAEMRKDVKRKNMHKNTDKKENTRKKILFLPKWIAAVAFLLVVIEVAFLGTLYYFVLNGNKEPAEKISQTTPSVEADAQNLLELSAESTLLTTGLTIIGLAIAVWAGLNIANTIDKKTLDDLERNSKEMEKQQKQAFEDLRGLKDSVEDVRKTLRFAFEQELLRTSSRLAMSHYFYKLFSKNATPVEITADLIIIEQLFAQVFDIHDGKPTGNTQISEKASQGIDNIEKLLQRQGLGANVKLYLGQRKADFFFYQGYEDAQENALLQHEHYSKAAQQYEIQAEEMGIGLPQYVMEFNHEAERKDILAKIRELGKAENVPNYYGNEENKPVTIFMVNTIGEAYSKILQRYKYLIGEYGYDGYKITVEKMYEYAYRAIFMLSCAKKWASENKAYFNEVYARNLGCVYERLEDAREQTGEYREEVIENYKLAFRWAVDNDRVLSDRVTSIYKVLLTYCKKYLDKNVAKNVYTKADTYGWKKDMKKSDLVKAKAEWQKEAFDGFKDNLGEYKSPYDEDCVHCIKDMLKFSEFGMRDKRRLHISYVMNGFAYTYILILKYAKKPKAERNYPEEAGVYLKKIAEDIDFLDMMGMTDDFSNHLRGRNIILSIYEKEFEKKGKESQK